MEQPHVRTTRSGGIITRGTSSPPRGRGMNRGQRGRSPIVWNQGDIIMTQQGCEFINAYKNSCIVLTSLFLFSFKKYLQTEVIKLCSQVLEVAVVVVDVELEVVVEVVAVEEVQEVQTLVIQCDINMH